MDAAITPSFISDKDQGFTYFQDQHLSISDSIQIHLKPSRAGGQCKYKCVLFVDWVLSVAFYYGHVYYFITGDFENESNHMLHILLGVGFTNIILFYAFTDGARFLRSNFDKVLYLISCLLQKPILLPILCPSRFRSRIAVKHLDTHTFELRKIEYLGGRAKEIKKQIQPTNFLMAVQETNFLYSITLSGFIATSVTSTMLLERQYTGEDAMQNAIMLSLAAVYFLYGLSVSFTLYGRKTDFLRRIRNNSIDIDDDDLREEPNSESYFYESERE